MSESCPKCGANRTQFDGQTSWECGSYQSLLGGSHIKRPAFKLIESEHCLCRTALAAATKRAEDLQATADRWKSEAERLRSLGVRQQQEIETLGEMADAVERLREIGRATGCDHVDDPDGRTRLVRCVEEVIGAAEQENAALTAEVERLKDAANIALEHAVELSDAWMRGVIRESDGNGGLRSNRNADVEYFLRCAINGKDRPKINVVYSPAWLFSEDRPDA